MMTTTNKAAANLPERFQGPYVIEEHMDHGFVIRAASRFITATAPTMQIAEIVKASLEAASK